MPRRPPALGGEPVADRADGLHLGREQQGLADGRGDGLELLLVRLLPEVDEVRRDEDAAEDLAAGRLELADLRRVILGAVLEPAAVDHRVARLLEHRRLTGLGVGPAEAVGVVRPHGADLLVGLELVPHAGEHGGDVLEAPEDVVGPREGLVGRGAAAEEVRLPRAVVGDAGHLQSFRLVGDRVHRVRRGGDLDDVDAVVGDEVAGDGGGAVRVGLGVLDDDVDRVDLAVTALDAVLGGSLPLLHQPLVGLAEGGEVAGQRADEADLDGAARRTAAAARAAARAAAARGEDAAEAAGRSHCDAGDTGRLEEVATSEGRLDAVRRPTGLVLRTHTASLRGQAAPPPSLDDVSGRGPPDGLLFSGATNGCRLLPHPAHSCARDFSGGADTSRVSAIRTLHPTIRAS